MSSDIEPAVEAALAIFGEDGPLRPLSDQFGKSTSDALAQYGTRWFEKRASSLWNSARKRVSKSGRTPQKPRVQAAIEITKHGAAEERPDLRVAYENLAARSMTQDGWSDSYEEYARKLSGLQAGDISLLSAMYEDERVKRAIDAGKNDQRKTSTSTMEAFRASEIRDISKMAEDKAMGAIDRLELNGLLQVRAIPSSGGASLHPPVQNTREPGVWFKGTTVGIDNFVAALTPLGVDLIEHIADLKPLDNQESC